MRKIRIILASLLALAGARTAMAQTENNNEITITVKQSTGKADYVSAIHPNKLPGWDGEWWCSNERATEGTFWPPCVILDGQMSNLKYANDDKGVILLNHLYNIVCGGNYYVTGASADVSIPTIADGSDKEPDPDDLPTIDFGGQIVELAIGETKTVEFNRQMKPNSYGGFEICISSPGEESRVMLTNFKITVKTPDNTPKLSTPDEQHWYYFVNRKKDSDGNLMDGADKILYCDGLNQQAKLGDKPEDPSTSYVWSFWDDGHDSYIKSLKGFYLDDLILGGKKTNVASFSVDYNAKDRENELWEIYDLYSTKDGMITNNQTEKDPRSYWSFEEVTGDALTTLKEMAKTESKSLVSTTLNDYSSLEAQINAGKVGFPKKANYEALKDIENDDATDFIQVQDAVLTFLYDINLPESGKAYKLINTNPVCDTYGDTYLTDKDGTLVFADAASEDYSDTWVAGYNGNSVLLTNGKTGGYINPGYNTCSIKDSHEKDYYGNFSPGSIAIQQSGGGAPTGLVTLRSENTNMTGVLTRIKDENDTPEKNMRAPRASDDNYNQVFRIEEVEYPTTATVNEPKNIENIEGICTYSAPYPFVLPGDYEAWYVTGDINNNEVHLERMPSWIIPANYGVIITGRPDVVTIHPAGSHNVEETIPEGAGLLGNTAGGAKTLTAGQDYILATKDNVKAFYAIDENDLTVAANKAYLHLEKDGAATRLVLDFSGKTDAIESVKETTAGRDGVYDLQGRRAAGTKKGIYIRNGKKMLVK